MLSTGQGASDSRQGRSRKSCGFHKGPQRQSRCSHFSDDENSSGTLTALSSSSHRLSCLSLLLEAGTR